MALLILGAAAVQARAVVNIPADDQAIRYTGRFNATDPKQPSCDWPGCSIQARFTGTSITVMLSGGDNQFNVFIDGLAKPKIIIDKAKTSYVAAANLSAGAHTLLLTKRTEGFQGVTAFSGFQLEDGQALAALPPRPAKRIQFIGDSFTVGYGVESNTLACADRTLFDNNYLAYGPITARAVDAEYSVQAVSGSGMVHNYGDLVPVSAQPMPPFSTGPCSAGSNPNGTRRNGFPMRSLSRWERMISAPPSSPTSSNILRPTGTCWPGCASGIPWPRSCA